MSHYKTEENTGVFTHPRTGKRYKIALDLKSRQRCELCDLRYDCQTKEDKEMCRHWREIGTFGFTDFALSHFKEIK